MNSAGHLQAFTKALAQDHELVLEMAAILRRAQQFNIDYRSRTRRRLRERSRLLVHNIKRHRGFLYRVGLDAVRDRDSLAAIDHLLGRALRDAVSFHWALSTADLLAPEKEPELDALIAVRWLLAESMTVASTLAARPARRTSLPMSQLIARLGARLLPWEERQRYLDEYLSELDELAQDGPRRAQLGHALRLLVRAPALRWALRRAPETPLYAYRESR
jgi:hypothetical protein